MNPAQTAFLHTVDLFANLSLAQVEQISRYFHVQTRARGDILFLEGSDCQIFYVVAAGRVRLYETSIEGKEQSLFVMRAREFFDVIALIDSEPHPVSAVAMTDVRLYVIGKQEMLDLIRRYPSIASTLLPQMSWMLRQLATLVGDLSFGNVATRLDRLILQHACEEGVMTPQGILLPWGLTHYEIAHSIGTAREVVTRSLHRLEQEGIIESKRGELLIKSLKKLKERTVPPE